MNILHLTMEEYSHLRRYHDKCSMHNLLGDFEMYVMAMFKAEPYVENRIHTINPMQKGEKTLFYCPTCEKFVKTDWVDEAIHGYWMRETEQKIKQRENIIAEQVRLAKESENNIEELKNLLINRANLENKPLQNAEKHG